MRRDVYIFVVCVLGMGSSLMAQAGAPATRPATTSAPARHVLVVPPGFSVVTVGQHSILVEPVDQAWAKQVLDAITPTTLPSTRPSTIQELLTANRQQLATRMATDLALADNSALDKLLSDKLVTALKKLDRVSPPLFYFVTTESRVKELLKAGWSDPRFHYNRLADSVDVSIATVTASGAADDVIVPIFHKPEDAEQGKITQLTNAIHDTELSLAQLLGEQAVNGTHAALATFIVEEVFAPIKLSRDQEWLGVGLAGVLSCRYGAILTGVQEQQLIQLMTLDNPRNPIRATALDLLHPPDLSTMRDDAIRYYADAFRSKSSRAVQSWLLRSGDSAIPKLLTELRKSRPADGAGLVALMKQISGVDISSDVAPGK